MELLEGEPLDGSSAAGRSISRTLIDLGTQIADALDAAHGEGILHRDIKPANIFLTRRGQAKVLDFGLAKLAPATDADVRSPESHATEHFSSMAGTTVGTVAYMSPEQARGEDLDPRTDLFSFGVVLYEMATGRQSFPGHTTAVIFDGILNRDPAPPRSLNPPFPPSSSASSRKALEKDRGLRYQSAADMRADLQRLKRDSASGRVAVAKALDDTTTGTLVAAPYAGAAPTVTLPEASSAAVRSTADTSPLLPVQPLRPPVSINKAALVLGAMALVALLATLGTFLLTSRSSSTTDATPPAPEGVPPASVPAASAADAIEKPSVPAPSSGATTTAPVASSTVRRKGIGRAASPGQTRSSKRRGDRSCDARRGYRGAPEQQRRRRGRAARDRAREDLQQSARTGDRRSPPDSARLPQLACRGRGVSPVGRTAREGWQTRRRHGRACRVQQAFANDRRAAGSKLRLAELTLRSRQPDRELAARAVLSDIVRLHPRTPEAFQALQMKMKIETDRRQLREFDPAVGAEVPALMTTLRALAEMFPKSPASMVALNRLAMGYMESNRFGVAAQALIDLATRFPDAQHDAWFRLGELYERRLKDPAKAKEAYAKVPANSPRYKDAQRRMK